MYSQPTISPEVILQKPYARKDGGFYVVASTADDIAAIQEFQRVSYGALSEQYKPWVSPRSAEDRLRVLRDGGSLLTVRDSETHKIIGTMIVDVARDYDQYYKKIMFKQNAGRPCLMHGAFYTLSTTFVDAEYQNNGISEAMFEAALALGARNYVSGYGFLIGHDNLPYIKCALQSGFYIVGSGKYSKHDLNVFLFEKLSSGVAIDAAHQEINRPIDRISSLIMENYLEDDYAIIGAGRHGLTIAKMRYGFMGSATASYSA